MKELRTLQGKKTLVIGGAGFIGSHLCDALLALNGPGSVAILDNLFLGTQENIRDAIQAGAKFYELDAEDAKALDRVLQEFKPSAVVNCATKALNYSFIDPADAFSTNTNVIMNLLEALRTKKIETLCHFSSSEVYGSAVYEPMDEKHPLNPTTTYAAGKAAADIALEAYVRMFDLDAFILRPFNNFGPRQNSKPPLAGVIPLTVRKIVKNEKPEIHGSGKQTRDFTYVLDTVRLTLDLYRKVPRGESVHIASAQVLDMQNVIEKICREMKFPIDQILRLPARTSDVLAHAASNQKMNTFGKFTFTPFDEGLKKTIAWLVTELKGHV